MVPKGPKGEKGPADVIGAAVMVGKIATGEIVELPKSGAFAVAGGAIPHLRFVKASFPRRVVYTSTGG
jgi:hypothetical protein